MTEFKAIKAGHQVKVDFVSESRTEFSGNRFTGEGVVDRVEDGRVFGRLDNGTPFMCGMDDVQVITRRLDIHNVFQKWFTEQDFYTNMRFNYGNNLFNKELGVYCILPVQIAYKAWIEKQAKIDKFQKQIEDQIDVLKAASKSHAYNYREQNIMLSQADDLEKILRGEHED